MNTSPSRNASSPRSTTVSTKRKSLLAALAFLLPAAAFVATPASAATSHHKVVHHRAVHHVSAHHVVHHKAVHHTAS
jgi:hypothetical protein